MTLADPIAIACDLIRCPSVTPAEGGALGVLEAALAGAGFAVERVTFSEPGFADVQNLYARIGSSAPRFAFAGHTDVVGHLAARGRQPGGAQPHTSSVISSVPSTVPARMAAMYQPEGIAMSMRSPMAR